MHRWNAEPLWEFFEAHGIDVEMMQPRPLQGPAWVEPPTAWEVQKAANRLQKTTEKIESRRWLPTLANRLNGKALRELRAAHDLLQEAGSVLTEVRNGN